MYDLFREGARTLNQVQMETLECVSRPCIMTHLPAKHRVFDTPFSTFSFTFLGSQMQVFISNNSQSQPMRATTPGCGGEDLKLIYILCTHCTLGPQLPKEYLSKTRSLYFSRRRFVWNREKAWNGSRGVRQNNSQFCSFIFVPSSVVLSRPSPLLRDSGCFRKQ